MHHLVPSDRLAGLFDANRGLTADEVEQRQRLYGSNDILGDRRSGWGDIARDTARDPMVWLLVATAFLFAWLGDYIEASVLALALVPIAGMDAYLHRRTQATTEGLAGRLATQARVLRDGVAREIPSAGLVPGDLVIVNESESFPADGVLVAGVNLQADESALTGEAMPVRKRPFKGAAGESETSLDNEYWGAAGTGKLVAVRKRILIDGGAYASSSTAVISNACSFAVGPYAVENVEIEGLAVYTNNPPCGAMRGFGAVQTCFAAEAQMDRLAEALDIDPIELRLLNALEPGGTLATGQVVTGSLPTRDVIRRAAALPVPPHEALPRDVIRLPGGAGNTTRGEGVRRGVGFAVGFKNICYSEGFDDYCTARVRLGADGSAEVHCAAAEVGQGVSDVILEVARLELGTEEIVLAPARLPASGRQGRLRLRA